MADAMNQSETVSRTDDPRETASVSDNGTTTADPNTTDPNTTDPKKRGDGDTFQ